MREGAFTVDLNTKSPYKDGTVNGEIDALVREVIKRKGVITKVQAVSLIKLAKENGLIESKKESIDLLDVYVRGLKKAKVFKTRTPNAEKAKVETKAKK